MHPCLVPNGIQHKRISGSTALGADYSDFYLCYLQTCNLLCSSVNICGVFQYAMTSKNKYQTPRNYSVLQLVGSDELMVSLHSELILHQDLHHSLLHNRYLQSPCPACWFFFNYYYFLFQSNNYTWLFQRNSVLTDPDTSPLPSGATEQYTVCLV